MESASADASLDLIGDGRLRSQTHRVICSIFAAVTWPTEDEQLVLSGWRNADEAERQRLLQHIWKSIEKLPPQRQGGLRLLVGLLHPDKPVDQHYAEYLVEWAGQRGLTPEQTSRAFLQA